MATPESKLQNKINKYLKDRDIIVVKYQQGMTTSAGFPDEIVVYKGVFLGLEFKVPGNYPSKIQNAWNHKLVESSAFSIVVYELQDVIDALAEIDYKLNGGGLHGGMNPFAWGKYEGKTK